MHPCFKLPLISSAPVPTTLHLGLACAALQLLCTFLEPPKGHGPVT